MISEIFHSCRSKPRCASGMDTNRAFAEHMDLRFTFEVSLRLQRAAEIRVTTRFTTMQTPPHWTRCRGPARQAARPAKRSRSRSRVVVRVYAIDVTRSYWFASRTAWLALTTPICWLVASQLFKFVACTTVIWHNFAGCLEHCRSIPQIYRKTYTH